MTVRVIQGITSIDGERLTRPNPDHVRRVTVTVSGARKTYLGPILVLCDVICVSQRQQPASDMLDERVCDPTDEFPDHVLRGRRLCTGRDREL